MDSVVLSTWHLSNNDAITLPTSSYGSLAKFGNSIVLYSNRDNVNLTILDLSGKEQNLTVSSGKNIISNLDQIGLIVYTPTSNNYGTNGIIISYN
ncbi:hypothetical protein COJ46_01665 [Bacillus sp. AFS077874]|uniref:hypothetical protein n=1 Tax=unclassified Bacillus (in: firmicutes) TaxID=185979 RepID=UPI000BEBE008|nr:MULTISPECIES: hypothetical protein [unclassified Bacillus (in: firmicutes)]PEC50954.1 hypothetical protein CON00_04375 [Bacillus sp. AFS096315]PFM83254.1 hypothetical protein COJ46_01665 [Bacillus sp. AFS077874]